VGLGADFVGASIGLGARLIDHGLQFVHTLRR
jgi:hypothetical protein